METNNNIRTFSSGCESFFNFSIIQHILWPVAMILCIYEYVDTYYAQYMYIILIATILLMVLLFIYPLGYRLFYYRWLVFKRNKDTTLLVDMASKTFTYTHKNSSITFTPKDVKKWNWSNYAAFGVSFVKIARIRLNNGITINISSGIGDVIGFLQENGKQLGFPKGTFRYGDHFRSLQTYIENQCE